MTVYEIELLKSEVEALRTKAERATKRLCACRDCGGQGEVYSGHSTSQGHNQPPEPDMDVCGTCGGDGVLGPIEDFEALAAERDQLKTEVERQSAEIRELKDAIGGLKWVVGEMKGRHKNLHRSLCARFGYVHDEKDWWRDDVSLEEHIAAQIGQLKAEVAARERQAETLAENAYLHAQIQRAAGELPSGWAIQIMVERGGGGVSLFDCGDEVEFDGQGDLGEQVSDALDIALGKGEQS